MYKLSDRKLSQYQADKIRELNLAGIGTKKLAEQFGITRTAVKAILQNKTYKTTCKQLTQSKTNVGNLF